MLFEVRDHLRGNGHLQRHRRQRIVLVRANLPAESPEGGVEDLGQLPHFRVAARAQWQVGRPEHDRRRDHVTNERAAVAVDDRAARSLDAVEAKLVLERGCLVLLRRKDLERPQPEEEDAERDQCDATEDGNPHRHARCQQIRLLDLRVGREEARQLLTGTSQEHSPLGRTSQPGGEEAAAGRRRRPAT